MSNFTAHDVRHICICKACGHIGDSRKMLALSDGEYHDACAIAKMSHEQILSLPSAELDKIGLRAAGPELMRKLMENR